MPLPYQISTLLYCFDPQGNLLLLQRTREPNLGFWSPAGGKLQTDRGESPFACALREAAEELQLVLRPADLHLTGLVSEHAYQGQAHWLMFLFEVKTRLAALPPPIPEGRFQFFPPEALATLPIPATDREQLWPLFWQHRGGFFAAHCQSQPDGPDLWTIEASLLAPATAPIDLSPFPGAEIAAGTSTLDPHPDPGSGPPAIIDLHSDSFFMNEALRQARRAAAAGEVPVGAVVVRAGRILARAFNQVELLKDATAHAEMLALTQAQAAVGDWRLTDCTLYVTKEPCPMCAGAIVHTRISRVVFGAADPKAGAAGGALNLLQFPSLNHRCLVTGGVAAPACATLLRQFFAEQRAARKAPDTAPAPDPPGPGPDELN